MAQPARNLIVDVARKQLVCSEVTVADRPVTRARGLLGRSALRSGEGLLLTPAPSIHTAFMRFPIDVIFLDASSQVVKLVRCMKPWRVAIARKARSALELEAGAISTRGVQVGDVLSVLDLEVWHSQAREDTRVLH